MGRKWKRKSSATTFQTQTKVKLKRSKSLGEMWTRKRKKKCKRKRKPIHYPSVSAKKPFIVHLHPICSEEEKKNTEEILNEQLFHWLCLLCGHACANTNTDTFYSAKMRAISVSLFLGRNEYCQQRRQVQDLCWLTSCFGSKWSLVNVNDSATRLAPDLKFILIFSGAN